jgi:GNAT superfamily N-acetyltransferase
MANAITIATLPMIPTLKQIWMACFGGGEGYTDYIFAGLIPPERILAMTGEGGEPVAMLCLQPFTYRCGMRTANGEYIYGVATAPEHQGKGYSTALLEECHRLLAARGTALSVLVPASESLFGFYGARGYMPFASVKQASYHKDNLTAVTPCEAAPADIGELTAIRDSFCGEQPFVCWGEDYMRYIGSECRQFGGDVLSLSFGDKSGYAICYPADGRVIVKELVIAEDLLDHTAATLLSRFSKEECLVYLPASTTVSGPNKVLPYAMVRWYDIQKQLLFADCGEAYIANVLDD